MNKTKSKSKRQKRKQKVLRDREYEKILEKSDKCLNKIPQKRFFSHEIPPQYRERVQLLNQHIQHSLAHYYKHGKNYFEPLIKLLFDFPISEERFKTIITISITTTNSDPYKPEQKLDIMYFLKHLNSMAHGIFREDKDVSVNILLNMLRPKEFFNQESSQKHYKYSGIVKKNTPLKTDLEKEQERPGNKINEENTLPSISKIVENNKNKSFAKVNKVGNENKKIKLLDYLENLFESGRLDSEENTPMELNSRKNENQGSIQTNENDVEKKEGEWKEVAKKDKICNKMGKCFAEFKVNDYNKNIKDFETGNKIKEAKTLSSKPKRVAIKIEGNNKNKSSTMVPKKENKIDNKNNENKTSEYLENLFEFGSFDSDLKKKLNIQTDKSTEISKESTEYQKNEHQGSIETNENDDDKEEGEWKEVTKKDKICNKMGKRFTEFKINDNNKYIKDFKGGNKIKEAKTLSSKPKRVAIKIEGNNKNKSSAMVPKKENKIDNKNNENKTSEYLENLREFGSFDSDFKKKLNIQTDKSTEISKESTEYQKNEHQGSIETNENDDEKKEGEWKEVTKRGKISNKMNNRFAEFKINNYKENIEDFEAVNKINKATKNKNKSSKKENNAGNKNNGKKSSEYLKNHFEFSTFDSDFKKMLNIQTEISKESQKNENRGSIETNENGDEKDEGEWKKITKKDKISNRIFKIKDHNENIRNFDSDSDQNTASEKTKSKKKRKKASKQNDYFVKNANDNQKSKNTNENEEGERKNIKENFNENINFADLELPMKIHGIGDFYESDNFSEDGFSDFDDDYYKYLPPPIKINPKDVVVIIARLN